MVSMHYKVLLPVQILVPFVHSCNDCETFLFDLRVLFFSVVKHTGGSCCKRTPPIASSETSTMVKTLVFFKRGSFSLIVGMAYTGLWILCLSFGSDLYIS